MKTNTEENSQFRILSALGIIFVVAGHLGYGVFDMGGLFPYYSFHVFIFLFVSGYFYKDEAEKHIGDIFGKSAGLCCSPISYGICFMGFWRKYSVGLDSRLGNLCLLRRFFFPLF